MPRASFLDTARRTSDNRAMDSLELPPNHRSGFVAVIGRPNVGKSTLMNNLIGQPITPVSSKPQTTRQNQLAILTLGEGQIVFVDTPGIHEPHHKLGEWMDQASTEVIRDSDIGLVLFDASEPPTGDDRRVAERLASLRPLPPLIVALNKTDLLSSPDLADQTQIFADLIPTPDLMLDISASEGTHVETLLNAIIERLPLGPRYYPEDQITDRYERDVAADMIRAACLQLLREEVPHSIAVRMDDYVERGDSGAHISATLFVDRASQKSIVIGKGGSMIRDIGAMAREQIELMSGRRIYLDLRVKVLPGWRNDPQALDRFGYGSVERRNP